jgi:hypothetical protein
VKSFAKFHPKSSKIINRSHSIFQPENISRFTKLMFYKSCCIFDDYDVTNVCNYYLFRYIIFYYATALYMIMFNEKQYCWLFARSSIYISFIIIVLNIIKIITILIWKKVWISALLLYEKFNFLTGFWKGILIGQ